MPLGDPYATLAQVKLRIGETGTGNDAALTSALGAGAQSIEGVCGRQFNDAGSASARVYYPDSPVLVYTEDFSTTTGLVVKADYGNDGIYEYTYDATNYQVEPLNGIFDGTTGWPYNCVRAINQFYPLYYMATGSPRASIQITARWGWAAVPAAIVEANLILGEEIFKIKDAPFGVAGFDVQGYSLRVRENPKVMALLSRYMTEPILAR